MYVLTLGKFVVRFVPLRSSYKKVFRQINHGRKIVKFPVMKQNVSGLVKEQVRSLFLVRKHSSLMNYLPNAWKITKHCARLSEQWTEANGQPIQTTTTKTVRSSVA